MLVTGASVVIVEMGDNSIVTRGQRFYSVATTALRKKDTDIENTIKEGV